jgi:hypothetical protein
MTMALYRKKPVVIEAMRWEPGDLAAAGEVVGWLMAHGADFHHPSGLGPTTTLAIRTLEGEMTADPGDWIIRGVKGEFYPCKPDIFAVTYEPAGEKRSDEDRIRDAMTEAQAHPGRVVTR